MIYSSIIWTLVIDRILFQVTSNSWALLGAATIISSLFLVTIVGKGGKSCDTTAYSRKGSTDVEFPEMVSLDEMKAHRKTSLLATIVV
jgi:hypothetical protein